MLPYSLLQQKHMQGRLLHTVTTRQTAMCWDGVFLTLKSIIGRAFDHSCLSTCLPHLSLQVMSIIVLHQDLAPSGALTYLTPIILSPHSISCITTNPQGFLYHFPAILSIRNRSSYLCVASGDTFLGEVSAYVTSGPDNS